MTGSSCSQHCKKNSCSVKLQDGLPDKIKIQKNKQQSIVFGLYRTLHDIENTIESTIATNTEWAIKNFAMPTLFQNSATQLSY